jgi:rhodanese-related sulfurtransferase
MSLLLPTFSFLLVVGETQSYKNIDVAEAYKMIEEEIKYPNLIVLDVRTNFEFYASHLYDAQIIPHDEIESRITELEDYKEYKIIVYCKSGGRSSIACEILVAYGFSEVYNMLGGIMEWVVNDYPVWALSHRIQVETLNNIIIEPLIPNPPLGCGCPFLDPSQEETCSDDINMDTVILEENEEFITQYSTIIIDGITHEVMTKISYLFNAVRTSDDYTERVEFNFNEISNDDIYTTFFTLKYEIQHIQYNLTVLTILTPLNSESYDIGTTLLIFTVPEESLHTVEIIDFNYSPISLSEHYKTISQIAKKMKIIFKESFKISGDQGFKQLIKNYNIIEKKLKGLSKFVEKKISEYNLLIQENYATIRDACNPVMLMLCWVVIEGIEIMGCGAAPWLFCFTIGLIFSVTIGIYAALWGLVCGGMFTSLCTWPNRAVREWYCGVLYGCF